MLWALLLAAAPAAAGPLTIDAIFDGPHVARAPEQVVLVVTGDLILARGTNAAAVAAGDFDLPFQATGDLLADGDVTFGDLEAPLVAGCRATLVGMTFCGHPRFAPALARHFDVVAVSTNHALDQGRRGLDETVLRAKRAGLAVCGDDETAVLDVRGTRVAFLSFNAVSIGWLDKAALARQVGSARAVADLVVVQVHWGREYVEEPQDAGLGAPDAPRRLGRLAVDAGADLVVGNHPHWIQGVELYRGKLIAYAHGNFVFDQTEARRTRESVVGRYVFQGASLVDVQYTPLLVRGVTTPAPDPDGARVLARMKRASARLARWPLSQPAHTAPELD